MKSLESSRKRSGIQLAVMTASVLLVTYVETMIIPAIPLIQHDLDTSTANVSWILTVVLLMGAIFSPLFGKLGDIYGKKLIFMASLLIYTLGALTAVFANSIYVLVGARALQGVGFAVLPLSLAMIPEILPSDKTGLGQGIVAGSAALSAILGLIIGAWVVQSYGWRSAFLSAVILSLLLIILSLAFLQPSKVLPGGKVDYPSALALMGGVGFPLLYLSEGAQIGWESFEALLLLIVGVIAIISFLYQSLKSSNPLIPLGLLRERNVLIANVIAFLAAMANFVAFFAFIYLAELPKPYGFSLNVLETGRFLLPAVIAMLIGGILAGIGTSKIGPKPIIFAGSVLMMLGFVLFLVNRATVFDLQLDAVISLGGMMPSLVSVVNMISVSLPKEFIAVGQSVNTTLKSVGNSVGPVVSAMFMTQYTVGNTELPSSVAFNSMFLLSIITSILIIVISLFISNYRLGQPQRESKDLQ